MTLFRRVRTRLDRHRTALARQAVGAERLRFARDLHDVLGHTLTAITVKGELACALVRRRPDAAEQELRELLQLARAAHREVRAVVGGYRTVSLRAELDGVRAVLTAAGIACTVDTVPLGSVSAAAVAPLAYALREGATNVLRHSAATWCRISLRREDGTLLLRIVNDGTAAAGAADADAGNGLRGLRERLAGAHGRLWCEPAGEGRHQLLVRVPVASAERVLEEVR
jgi:two-component system sensor histidine kinase DesK